MERIDKDFPLVVKITINDDGDRIDSPKWHYINDHGSGQNTLCTGEYFGIGESAAEYEQRKGKVTCPECLALIRQIKTVRLR
jgi:hypothetical protein